jgi:hypothetical protein
MMRWTHWDQKRFEKLGAMLRAEVKRQDRIAGAERRADPARAARPVAMPAARSNLSGSAR